MKADTAGFFKRLKDNPIVMTLVIILALSVVIMGYIASVLYQDATRDQSYQQLVSNLRVSSFELTALSRDATAGDEAAFTSLQRVVVNMDANWGRLKSSDDQTRLMMSSQLSTFESSWSATRDAANVIIGHKETVLLLNNVASRLNAAIPQLQNEHTDIVEILLDNRAPADQVSMAQRQIWRAERIGRNVDKMLRGGENVDRAADEFNADARIFGAVLLGMQQGDGMLGVTAVTDSDALESLAEVSSQFSVVSDRVLEIYQASPSLFEARTAADAILNGSGGLLESLSAISDKIVDLPAERKINTVVLLAVAGIALLTLLVVIWQLNQATKIRLKETADTNDRNQNAILRLLDELADLADGDLTTTATVTEDFTGAIADSINYTIDQLRILVSGINETSARVVTSSSDTQQTALHLAEAAEHQAQEIAGASAAINEMAVTIDQVSANAAESAGVAERSVSIANNGAKVVQNTINGMDTIREQIQDTSKRIKRLGESSQEIGDIVGLINDIADQTNILALNAAIQASMAGDAGRGFAVVADEVQRLAERSATATKQIESLVKTIQNDTNEAVISMEQTTSEVVRGARLAQDAGVALEEIEGVSANLAGLIQNISNAARQQASSAGHISNTMNVIQEITSQTSAGTNATAKSIGNLAELATELSESVSGFTLPKELNGDAEEHVDEDSSIEELVSYSSEDVVSDYEADESIDEVATLHDEVIDLTEAEMLTDFEGAYAEETDEDVTHRGENV